MGLVTLVGVYAVAPRGAWMSAVAYCALVFGLGLTCVALSSGPAIAGWRAKLVHFTYRPAIVLGRSRTLFSVVFLFGLSFFYSCSGCRDFGFGCLLGSLLGHLAAPRAATRDGLV